MTFLAISVDRAGDRSRWHVTTNNPEHAWSLVREDHERRAVLPQRILVCIPGGKQ